MRNLHRLLHTNRYPSQPQECKPKKRVRQETTTDMNSKCRPIYARGFDILLSAFFCHTARYSRTLP